MTDGELKARLARILRAHRERCGLTQWKLARRVGREQAFVSSYETCGTPLSVSKFVRVCEALQLEADAVVRELLGEAERPPPVPIGDPGLPDLPEAPADPDDWPDAATPAIG